MKNIFTLLLLLCSLVKLSAQLTEGTPCTAACLDPTKSSITGRMPKANGLSPNLNRPCGDASEDNPTWWMMRPSGNQLTFTLSTSSCFTGGACAPGVTLTLFEGSSCGDVTAVGCLQGKEGVLSVSVTPCSMYYLQLDGNCETVCDVNISYDKNQILAEVQEPNISGAQEVCKGASTTYSASMSGMAGGRPDSWSWTLTPATAGTISPIPGTDDVKVKITDPPTGGTVSLCVKPVFNGKCAPKTNAGCIEILIPEDNSMSQTCNVELCPRQLPYMLNLSECLKISDVEPALVKVDLPAGNSSTETIKYSIANTTCQGTVDVNIMVREKSVQYFKQLPALLLCSGETKTIKGRTFSCADALISPLLFLKNEGLGTPDCDTVFELIVQCIDIATEITGKGVLDCNNNPLILDMGGFGSRVTPGSLKTTDYKGTGTLFMQWTKDGVDIPGATNKKLEVSTPGNYGLKVKYEYAISQNVNGTITTQSKTCANSTFFMVKSAPSDAVAETPVATASTCAGETATYFVNPDPNAQSYKWTVSGAQIVETDANPKNLLVKNNGAPYQVCLSKRACGKISQPSCISIKPLGSIPKPEIAGLSDCQGDSSFVRVGNRSSFPYTAHFSWMVENGSIRSWNLDSTMVKVFWKQGSTDRKISLIASDLCGKDTTTVEVNSTLPATLKSNSPVCTGLILKLNVEGGVYYNWDGPDGYTNDYNEVKIGGMTSAQAGLYTVTVSTSNGCSTVLSTLVEVNDLPSSAGSNSPVCVGNKLQLNASGGTTYKWEGPNGFSSTAQNPEVSNFGDIKKGTYTVTVSDASGCSAVHQIETMVTKPPVVTVNSNSPVCSGDNISLSASGGLTYSWTGPNGFKSTLSSISIPNAQKAQEGTYMVTVTGFNGCSAGTQASVVVNALPQATASSNSPVCSGMDANLVAQGGTSYSWSGPDNFKSNAQNPVISKAEAKNAGTYTVTVTDANNCKNTSSTVLEIKNCISTKDATGKNEITVFPNPANDRITIQSATEIVKVELFNTAGQKVMEKTASGNEVVMEILEISAGEHSLKVFTADKKHRIFKILIKK